MYIFLVKLESNAVLIKILFPYFFFTSERATETRRGVERALNTASTTSFVREITVLFPSPFSPLSGGREDYTKLVTSLSLSSFIHSRWRAMPFVVQWIHFDLPLSLSCSYLGNSYKKKKNLIDCVYRYAHYYGIHILSQHSPKRR